MVVLQYWLEYPISCTHKRTLLSLDLSLRWLLHLEIDFSFAPLTQVIKKLRPRAWLTQGHTVSYDIIEPTDDLWTLGSQGFSHHIPLPLQGLTQIMLYFRSFLKTSNRSNLGLIGTPTCFNFSPVRILSLFIYLYYGYLCTHLFSPLKLPEDWNLYSLRFLSYQLALC